MKKRNFKRHFAIVGSIILLLVMVASIIALEPKDLLVQEIVKREKTRVKMPEQQKEETPQEPEAVPQQESLLSTLAPDSFSSPQDLGGGVGFGSGGFGPSVGGGGGFGSDGGQLSKEKDNINRHPRLISKSALDYPADARQSNISGFVLLKILVNTGGAVESVKIEDSLPRGVFEAAATQSVKSWRFEPGIVKGKVVAAWTLQKIKFELN
jgi:TonB family protein